MVGAVSLWGNTGNVIFGRFACYSIDDYRQKCAPRSESAKQFFLTKREGYARNKAVLSP